MVRLVVSGWRFLMFNHRPLGLVSLLYLSPFQSDSLKIHRELFLRGISNTPQPIGLVLQLLLWFKWGVFYGWRSSLKNVRRYGRRLHEKTGISVWDQRFSLVRLSLFHTLPPGAYYQLQLYKAEQFGKLWTFVFNTESRAFHQMRSCGRNYDVNCRLLQDKRRFNQLADSKGVSVVEEIAFLTKGSSWDEILSNTEEILFFKPNDGAASRGAFQLWHSTLEEKRVLNISVLNGEKLTGKDAERFLQRCLQEYDYLVQPCLLGHNRLNEIAKKSVPMTLRVISEWHADGLQIYCAYLEVPVSATLGNLFLIVPVDEERGFAGAPLSIESVAIEEDVLMAASSISGESIPYWDEIRSAVSGAHELVSGIFAVAWDFVITDTKPILLEGNANWNVIPPQLIKGGLLDTGN